MTASGQTGRRMDWLLDDFVRATPGVRHSLVISGDGLRLAASREVGTALADGLSAAASGLVSLAGAAASLLEADPVSQTIVEMAGGYLFATTISKGSLLVVYTERQCDMGLVGYEMTMLANRVGHVLTPAGRAVAAPAATGAAATTTKVGAARPPSPRESPRESTRESPRESTR
jgi:predicted regulator of Ras-like GTPase activity (Roadblock/LC7/MglB family)